MKLSLIGLFFLTIFAQADIDRKMPTQRELGATVGTFLPWSFPGVRDQLRFWGVNYFHPTNFWNVESEFLNGRGSEVVYYTASVGPRFDYRLYDALDTFLNLGVAYHYYQRKPSRTQSFPFKSTGGIYFGFGSLIDVSGALKFRAEMKFHNSPGKSIYVGIGPTFVF